MMKNFCTLFALLIFLTGSAQSQVLLARWTFPTGTATDSLADGGLPVNTDKAIKTGGGTSAIDFSKNGATTKAAQATGWENGSMLKSWIVKVNSVGYDNLKLSSKMQSGGNNPGPRDFMVQYRNGESGTWTDVPGSTIVTTNEWTGAWLDSIPLPSACGNVASLYLRWIMTSNINSSGNTVTSNGINKIDDIYITGKQVNTAMKDQPREIPCSITPNPNHGAFRVDAPDPIASVNIFNAGGKLVFTKPGQNATSVQIRLDSIPSGTYFLKIKTTQGREGSQKMVIM